MGEDCLAQIGFGQNGFAEIHVGEFGIGKRCARQIGAVEVRAVQRDFVERHAGKIRPAQVCALEIRAAQFGVFQFRFA